MTVSERDEYFMLLALAEAKKGALRGEVPVGAVIECDGKVIARAHNQTEMLTDVTAHAEILAITAAEEALGGKYLPQCTLYVTVEPCLMCAGAIGWSQIGRIVYGARDPKRGYTTICTHNRALHPNTIVSEGVLAEEAAYLMKSFFEARRKRK